MPQNKTFEEILKLLEKKAEKHMSKWLDRIAYTLEEGRCAEVRYYDGYLDPIVEVGYRLNFQPISGGTPLKVGSVILCSVEDGTRILIVGEISKDGRKFRVEDYKKTLRHRINEWVDFDDIHGVALTATWFDYDAAERDAFEYTDGLELEYTHTVTF